MNIDTLNITKTEAAEAVIHYRRSLRERHNAEYEAVLKGYNQVLKGRKLIELSKVIAAGGADEKHRPRLAVIRADQQQCHVWAYQNGSVEFKPKGYVRGRSLRIVLPPDTLPRWLHPRGDWFDVTAISVVPLIPPQYLPAGALSGYHILWEATWEDIPADPALLKHLGGDLWAVLAMWDLTPLERAVLAGRAQE